MAVAVDSRLHPATRGFEAGERYERARPEYPAPAVDWLVGQLGLDARPGARVLDVGAGTGKLTRPLIERGLRVVAVEPIAGMRTVLERTAPSADVRAGRAEALPLADGEVDAIVVGQAFHWFASAEVLDEFARVVRHGDRLGLVWNRRDLEQPLHAAIHQLIAPYRRTTPAHGGDAWRAAFTDAAPFTPAAEQRFVFKQRLDADGVVDRVLSISFIAALPEHDRGVVEARVRELAGSSPPELAYSSEVFIYRRGG